MLSFLTLFLFFPVKTDSFFEGYFFYFYSQYLAEKLLFPDNCMY